MGSSDDFLILSGLVFGLSGGMSPGPLMTLVVSQSLRFGALEGMKISMAPLITDLPIFLSALFVMSRLREAEALLGILSLGGALFLSWMAWKTFSSEVVHSGERASPDSWTRGILTNLLNPNPYLFWFSVGGPLLVRLLEKGIGMAGLFLIGLYSSLVGSKIAVSVLAGRSGRFLGFRTQNRIHRILGLLLALYALYFFAEGLRMVSRRM